MHENGVKVAAYIIGEFGHKISDKSVTCALCACACSCIVGNFLTLLVTVRSGDVLFDALSDKFKVSSIPTKGDLSSLLAQS